MLVEVAIVFLFLSVADIGSAEENVVQVSIGSDAVFTCQNNLSATIIWNVHDANGTRLNIQHNQDLTPDSGRDNNGVLIHSLTILALPKYNESMIQCTTIIDVSGNHQFINVSSVMTLIIEGSCSLTVAFVKVPETRKVLVDDEAVFNCRHRTANETNFEIDGRPTDEHNVTVSIDESGTQVLIVSAIPSYHGAEVVCVADFYNGCPSHETGVALLLIQGPLRSVTEFLRKKTSEGNVRFVWTPPPTLDLTDAEPDIVYCIEIYNITCDNQRDLLSSDCYQLDPVYGGQFSYYYIYEIAVTPRSNVIGAINGTPLTVNETFIVPQLFAKEFINLNNSEDLTITFNIIGPGDMDISALWYTLTVVTNDNLSDLSKTERINLSDVNLSISLPKLRLWQYTINAYDCRQHQKSEIGEISTHEIQNVTVASSQPGEIRVTCNFIKNASDAKGVVVIVYPVNTSVPGTFYFQLVVNSTDELLNETISRLPGNTYVVSVFVLRRNGLPLNRSALLPQVVSVKESTEKLITLPIKYTTKSNASHICVTCTFTNPSATSCVVLVLSKSQLITIESTHIFNKSKSGDKAHGCIDNMNYTYYDIGVIGGLRENIGSVRDEGGTLSCAVIGGIIAAVLVVIFVIVVIIGCGCYWCRRIMSNKKLEEDTEMKGQKASNKKLEEDTEMKGQKASNKKLEEDTEMKGQKAVTEKEGDDDYDKQKDQRSSKEDIYGVDYANGWRTTVTGVMTESELGYENLGKMDVAENKNWIENSTV